MAEPVVRRRALRRGDLTTFVARHRLAWEIGMGLLAGVYLAVGFLADTGNGISPWIISVLAAIFLAEFFARLLDAPSRIGYVRHHWLDLVSSIPLIGGLRSLRLLQLLRLGAGVKVLSAAEQASLARGNARTSVWYVVPVLILLWFGAACACWVIEHGANPRIATFGDALYWAFINTMTIGYGNAAPATAAGHVLAGLLIFIGVGLVGFASARLTQMWLRDETQHHPRLMLEKMTQLEAEMASLKEVILAQQAGSPPGARIEREGPQAAGAADGQSAAR